MQGEVAKTGLSKPELSTNLTVGKCSMFNVTSGDYFVHSMNLPKS